MKEENQGRVWPRRDKGPGQEMIGVEMSQRSLAQRRRNRE